MLYSFPVAAIRNYHKLCGLRQQKFILFTIPEARNLQSRCWQDCAPSETRRRECFLASSSAGHPSWHPLACSSNLCLHHLMEFFPCVSVSKFPSSNKDTNHSGSGPTLVTSSWLQDINRFHLQRPYFQIRSHSQVPKGGLGLPTYLGVQSAIQPLTLGR